jgi:hypothetical protein
MKRLLITGLSQKGLDNATIVNRLKIMKFPYLASIIHEGEEYYIVLFRIPFGDKSLLNFQLHTSWLTYTKINNFTFKYLL